MSGRFIAYLPMSAPGSTTSEALVERIAALYPSVPMDVRPLASTAALGGAALVLGIDSTVITVIPVARKLPRDAYEAALDLIGVWPGAAAAMADHEAHLIVATVTSPRNHGEALEAAGATTFVCAALATLLPVVAGVWSNAAAIASPERLRRAAESVAAASAPLDLWIAVRFLDDLSSPRGERRIAALTSGLLPFVGREIEWMPSALPPVLIAERVLGTSQYLLAKGMVLADGETLGVSASEKIRIRFAEQGQRPGIPVVQLTPEAMEPALAGAGGAWGTH